jgi:hypothetical protein
MPYTRFGVLVINKIIAPDPQLVIPWLIMGTESNYT